MHRKLDLSQFLISLNKKSLFFILILISTLIGIYLSIAFKDLYILGVTFPLNSLLINLMFLFSIFSTPTVNLFILWLNWYFLNLILIPKVLTLVFNLLTDLSILENIFLLSLIIFLIGFFIIFLTITLGTSNFCPILYLANFILILKFLNIRFIIFNCLIYAY